MRRTMITGLVVGAGLAVTLVGWLFKASGRIVFESDEARTLGLQFETLPQVALRPLTLDELAQRLGVASGTDLARFTDVFAQRVQAGYLPQGWGAQCAADYPVSLCRGLEDYFDGVKTMKPNPRPRAKGSLVMDIRRLKSLQAEDFSVLVSRIPDWNFKQITKFADTAMRDTVSCPRNFSLALARKLEIHLPAAPAMQLLMRLQTHGLECLTPDQGGAEFNFLRAALFEIARQSYTDAIPLLEKAKIATERREEYRVLFWLARSYQSVGRTKEAAVVREQLFQKFPISWHTIVLKVEHQIDPLEQFLKHPAYDDKYEGSSKVANLRILWLQALLEAESNAMASKKFGEFVVKRLDPSLDPGVLQYLARCFDRAGFHRLQIISLNQLIQRRPEYLTRETLRLLYPKPFHEEIDRHSPHLDTAILLGLARQESGFDPTATSTANAKGLMQILPSTAQGIRRSVRREELYDYAKNIELGSMFIMSLIKHFDGSVEKSLAAYNAGQGSVGKWQRRFPFVSDPMLFQDIVPFRETRDYVPAILRNAYWYHRLFPEMTASLSDVITTSVLLRGQLFPAKPFLLSSPSSLNQGGLVSPVTDETSESQKNVPSSAGDAEAHPKLDN